MQGTQGFFASVGIPADLALLIGLLEVVGGILLIVGLITRITAILFIIEMIGAVLIVKASNSFMGEGGYEVDSYFNQSVAFRTWQNIYRKRRIKARDFSKDFIQKKE
ncbi:hypothetical protein BH23THE1_BH23THE1_36470 [soil metagenome]